MNSEEIEKRPRALWWVRSLCHNAEVWTWSYGKYKCMSCGRTAFVRRTWTPSILLSVFILAMIVFGWTRLNEYYDAKAAAAIGPVLYASNFGVKGDNKTNEGRPMGFLVEAAAELSMHVTIQPGPGVGEILLCSGVPYYHRIDSASYLTFDSLKARDGAGTDLCPASSTTGPFLIEYNVGPKFHFSYRNTNSNSSTKK